MADIRTIETGIARYIDAELIPKLPDDGLKRFGIGMVSGLVAKRGGMILEHVAKMPILQMLTVVDSSGGLDVGLLYEIAKEKVPSAGMNIEVPFVGKIKMYPADIEKLYRYICGEVTVYENY